jgi:hypothetical protein
MMPHSARQIVSAAPFLPADKKIILLCRLPDGSLIIDPDH